MSRSTTAALPAAALALAVTLSPLASRISNAQPTGLPGALGEPATAAPPPVPAADITPALAAPVVEGASGLPGDGPAIAGGGSSLSTPDALQPPVLEAPGSGPGPEGGAAAPLPRTPTPGLAQNTPPPIPSHPPVPPIPHIPPVPTPNFGPVPAPAYPSGPGGYGGGGQPTGRLGRMNTVPAPTPPVPAAEGGFPIPSATLVPSRAPSPQPFLIPGQPPGFATTPAPPKAPEPATTVAEDSPLLTNNRFDANFTGGITAAVVAEFLSHEVPGLNVLLPNNAGEIVMPDMQLKDVNMREFMAAITAASNVDMANGNPGYSLTSIPGAPNIVIFQRLQPAPAPYGQGEGMGGMGMTSGGGAPGVPGTGGTGFGGAGGGAFVPMTPGMPGGGGGVFSAPAPHSPPGKKETQFFDLSGILQSKELKVDDITTAIRTAWSSVEGGKMPPEGALKFHQETRLLIVTAAPDYMQSASSIVNLLLQRTQPSENERDQAMKAVEQKAMMVEEARMRAEDARKQAEMERQAVEERNRDVREKLQARITDLELELVKLRQQQDASAAQRR